ncbi:MAG TPA: DUF2147 domain-containing protein [Rhodopila sp.]|nr:DUF2147 domain-containing protein [Rhodopila sp.]
MGTVSRWPPRLRGAVLVVAMLSMPVPAPAFSTEAPEGLWFVPPDAAVQIFDCEALLCGRIVWMLHWRDAAGQIQRDDKNPDAASRSRLLCGLTILWGLRPSGPGRWEGGSFYNPHDGKTYSVTAEQRSSDAIVARIYKILPLFGKTKNMRRVAKLSSEGECRGAMPADP